MRAGGNECPENSLKDLMLIIDIWCNPAYNQQPQDIEIMTKTPDGDDVDPCTVYISMQHDAGCIFRKGL
jgi:hypothetical protein